MLSFSDAAADAAVIASASSSDLGVLAQEMLRQGRQRDARAVLIAYRIGVRVYQQFLVDPARGRGVRDAADKAAVGEVSLRMGMSRAKAGHWILLGEQLQRLPVLCTAFLDGEFALPRVGVLISVLSVVGDDLRARAEWSAIELARRPSTDPVLRSDLEKMLIELDPDAAVAAREEFSARNQNVRVKKDAFGHASVDATVPAEHGVFLQSSIAELLAQRVCRRDPRTVGQRRVVALAELLGYPDARLACECGGQNCALRADTTVPGPDHAAGETTAPEQTAPEHTAPETVEPEATEPDPVEPETPEPDAVDPVMPDPDQVPDEIAEPAAVDTDPDPTDPARRDAGVTVVVDPTGEEAAHLRGHGAIDPAHADDLAEIATTVELSKPDPPPSSPSWSGLIVVGNDPAPPVDPTGHGGLLVPPTGALIYAPGRKMRAEVLASDHWCRYPFCSTPSDRCQLDHLVKFDHADPMAGGWTVAYNLIPLCTPDHQRKHFGLWIPTMHTDRTVVWRNPETGEEITTHPR
ncbi:HNH endonuclease signature motif containing protein [Gordonia sp. OPL2]|uniref:HNH endonuclease signature motif containing protein n=1 Tax=Gordonia sp. OPL2 TaxID=2486274 RepID=UPI001654DACF|nr:HNH endonuclease signature motif containing protein [Gordonia sp. OPL2]ROZ99003.1 HNH endonuclease [Gordonia sp. OPL2]